MKYCSFCGKIDKEVSTLIVGPSVQICDECVLICVGIVAKKYPAYRYHVIGELDKARDAALAAEITQSKGESTKPGGEEGK